MLIGAILLWLMRAPILALIDEVAESASVPEPEIEDTGGEEAGDEDAPTMAAVAGDDA